MKSGIRVYSYASCVTCKKALKWLVENNIQFELLDISQEVPSEEIILDAIKQLGDRKYLFNTSGRSYRELGSKVVRSMSDKEAVLALCSDGKLIKRPFLIDSQGKVLLGFKQAIWEDHFLN